MTQPFQAAAYELEIKNKSNTNPEKAKIHNSDTKKFKANNITISAQVEKVTQEQETAKYKIKIKCDDNSKKMNMHNTENSKVNNTSDYGNSKAKKSSDYPTFRLNPETKKGKGSRDSPVQLKLLKNKVLNRTCKTFFGI